VTDHDSGLQIIDVSDPTNPALAAVYDTRGHAHCVAVQGDYAYVADWTWGLEVIEIFQRRYDLDRNMAQSTVIEESVDPVLRVRLTTTQNDLIQWEVSADTLAPWQEMPADGEWRVLTDPGRNLRWRCMQTYLGAGINPTCYELNLEYDKDVAGVDEEVGTFELMPASPNPFSTETAICFSLSRAETINLTVHDVRGRQVAVLAAGEHSSGEHRYVWRGGTVNSSIAPGIYFIRLRTGSGISKRKVIRLR
jgi:hypothetical protein